MARMMEAMGFLAEHADDAMSGSLSGAGGWPGMMGSAPLMPSLGNPVPYYGMGEMMEQLPALPGGPMSPPWRAGLLEGIWESPDGGLLIVQGSHYRLYQRCAGFVEGSLRLTSDRLVLRNRAHGIEHGFDTALQDGRLVLRGDDGQLYLYRRLLLDGSERRGNR